VSWPEAGRVAVLSPHLDDAVLSLGAAIARAVREGGSVTIVTVFAGDVESATPASNWDRLAGFATEGEAAAARRLEDAEACEILGAEPRALSFPDYPYVGGEREPARIVEAVRAATEDVELVLLPGFPLLHADHRLLADAVTERGLRGRRLALYAEQPYRFRQRARRPGPSWASIPAARRDRSAKWRAVRAYRTQLPLLQLNRGRLRRLLLYEARWGGEAIAWLVPPPRVSSGAS
jgi:LmbE family N-acetylglucosaminyl deacetylase